LEEHQTSEWELAGSNPSRTTKHLSGTSRASAQMIALLGYDVYSLVNTLRLKSYTLFEMNSVTVA